MYVYNSGISCARMEATKGNETVALLKRQLWISLYEHILDAIKSPNSHVGYWMTINLNSIKLENIREGDIKQFMRKVFSVVYTVMSRVCTYFTFLFLLYRTLLKILYLAYVTNCVHTWSINILHLTFRTIDILLRDVANCVDLSSNFRDIFDWLNFWMKNLHIKRVILHSIEILWYINKLFIVYILKLQISVNWFYIYLSIANLYCTTDLQLLRVTCD